MSRKKVILKGAFILTVTGLLTRVLGFFYRIFLSRTIGSEGMGLYQLIFPVYALGLSLTSVGMSTCISRCTAKYISKNMPRSALKLLYIGMGFSVFISCLATLFLQKNASVIATQMIRENRCTELLVVLSYSFPFAAVHGCINGYYFGMQQTKIPAFSQIIEQLVRILSVILICRYFFKNESEVPVLICVVGLVAGEVSSALFCFNSLSGKSLKMNRGPCSSFTQLSGELLSLSVPLTSSRVLTNLFQSVEAVSIPLCLQRYGLSAAQSLGCYGVLTGMALPCILFPSAITNSISTMLLPTVAEIQEEKNKKALKKTITNALYSCIFLGFSSCVFFLSAGPWIGRTIFKSADAGKLLIVLSFICPFLYANGSILGIINGLGRTRISFSINMLHLLVRLFSVFILIPKLGLQGYLWGLLVSQIFVFTCGILYLKKYVGRVR